MLSYHLSWEFSQQEKKKKKNPILIIFYTKLSIFYTKVGIFSPKPHFYLPISVFILGIPEAHILPTSHCWICLFTRKISRYNIASWYFTLACIRASFMSFMTALKQGFFSLLERLRSVRASSFLIVADQYCSFTFPVSQSGGCSNPPSCLLGTLFQNL